MPNAKQITGRQTKKISRKKATLVIQRFTRGWLTRHFYQKLLNESKEMKKRLKDVISSYKVHIQEIASRHETPVELDINLYEIYHYVVTLRNYEKEYNIAASQKENKLLKFNDIMSFFERLNLHPTQSEIIFAAKKVLPEKNYKDVDYTSEDIVNIVMHIYPPAGAHLKTTRKSTWLNPIVDNENAILRKFFKKGKSKKILKKTIQIISSDMKNNAIETSSKNKEKPNDQ
ncbi:uncharacterized protein LOC124818759 [Hydra vulgaris]|uniref:uncharacterized protein LOC124818759 n=1 Tax=Hydra vulgaris TaxID=6087 RepID=UPI0032E9C125